MEPIVGETSRELREGYLERHFVPMARAIFERAPEVPCVGLAVGQFWCDEAEDAVHAEVVPFRQRDPSWPADHDEEFVERVRSTFAKDGGYYRFLSRLPELDDNGPMITAFAAFCPEDCDQEMPVTESSVLYALARRSDSAVVEIEVVGRMLRPEWEDRFDVGFDAPEDPEAAAAIEAAVAKARRQPRGLLGRIATWFRRR